MVKMMNARSQSRGEKGYILLSIMLLMTLMVIALTIEAPRMAQQIKREKEEELIHRGNEYKSAIRRYFRKFGRYPNTVEQLENTNNMHFLRQRYNDPFTGKDDWRILHVGEVQINPLNQGTNTPGQPIGQPAGSTIGNPGGLAASSPALNPNQAAGSQISPNASASGQPGAQPSGNLGLVSGGKNSPVQFGGGAIIGVASTSTSESIKEINHKNHYNEWYFVYDPRLEQQTAPGAPGGVNPIGGSAPGINPAGGPGNNPLGGPGNNPLGGPGNNPLGGPGNNPPPGPKTGPNL
jgi:type II secretory pathway pseudopilin PulG